MSYTPNKKKKEKKKIIEMTKMALNKQALLPNHTTSFYAEVEVQKNKFKSVIIYV